MDGRDKFIETMLDQSGNDCARISARLAASPILDAEDDFIRAELERGTDIPNLIRVVVLFDASRLGAMIGRFMRPEGYQIAADIYVDEFRQALDGVLNAIKAARAAAQSKGTSFGEELSAEADRVVEVRRAAE